MHDRKADGGGQTDGFLQPRLRRALRSIGTAVGVTVLGRSQGKITAARVGPAPLTESPVSAAGLASSWTFSRSPAHGAHLPHAGGRRRGAFGLDGIEQLDRRARA